MTIAVGSLNTKDAKAQTTLRRLLLAKQLFLHGIDHSEKAGPLNKMIAIHNLHNAVEVVLRAIFLHFEIRPEKELNIGFENMLGEIDKHPGFRNQGVQLPYRQEMRNLNQVRNLVQHHALEPASSAVEESRVFVRGFLRRAYQAYFGCDFETISSISMIEDELLRELMELSSSEIATGDLKKALVLTDATFYWANAAIGECLPEPSWFLDRFDELQEFSHNLASILSGFRDTGGGPVPFGGIGAYGDSFPELKRFAKRLGDSLKHVQNRAAHYSALLASGVDLVDYRRFRDCTVITHFESSTDVSSTSKATKRTISAHWGDKEPSEQDAVWAHSFAVETIVRWQILGLRPRVPDGYVREAQRLLAWGDDVIVN
jgi:hypothetical protein